MPSPCKAFIQLYNLLNHHADECRLVDFGMHKTRARLLDGERQTGPLITYHRILQIKLELEGLMLFATLESNPSSDLQRLCIQSDEIHLAGQARASWTEEEFLAAACDWVKNPSRS